MIHGETRHTAREWRLMIAPSGHGRRRPLSSPRGSGSHADWPYHLIFGQLTRHFPQNPGNGVNDSIQPGSPEAIGRFRCAPGVRVVPNGIRSGDLAFFQVVPTQRSHRDDASDRSNTYAGVGFGRSSSTSRRTLSSSPFDTATSVTWRMTLRPWRPTLAPIFTGFSAQAGQRPRLRHLRHRQRAQEVARIVGERVQVQPHGVGGERAA